MNFTTARALQVADYNRKFADDTDRQIREFSNQRDMEIAGHNSNYAFDTIRQMRTAQYNQNGMAELSNNELTGRISILA
jgi:hypothetical protein